MKRYGLYWLRALTLGAGLNALIVGTLMTQRGWKFHQAAPLGGFICINLSFAADRIIFANRSKKVNDAPEPCSLHTPHACPGCSEYPCVCDEQLENYRNASGLL